MVKKHSSLTSVSLTGGGITPYESPSCTSVEISVNGPLCQSLDTDPTEELPDMPGELW